jgi:hypothetical protein
MSFQDKVKISRVLAATAAGTTAANCTAVDMAGYEGVTFVASFGTLTATQVTKLFAQQDTVSNMATAANIASSATGNLADNQSNNALVLDIRRPTKRYVRCVVSRGTANAVIDSVIAIQYGSDYKPTTHACYNSVAVENVTEGTP